MHEEEIATLEALTGCDRLTATQYLESCGWNVEDAYNTYSAVGSSPHPGDYGAFEESSGFGTSGSESQLDSDAQMAASLADSFEQPSQGGNTGGAALSNDYSDGVRAPTEYTTGRLVDDNPFPIGLDIFQSHATMASALGLQRTDGDPFQQTMPLPGLFGRGDSQFSTALNPPRVQDLPDSDWMFPLPAEAKKLNCGGDVAFARQRAKEERKWLLVSLQSVDIFDSHRMNRDVWGNDTVLSVLQSSFVFWQRSSSSEQGKGFMSLYNITDEMLPITIIIGPTGSQLFSQSGFVASAELSSALCEFIDSNELDGVDAPKSRHIRSSSAASPPDYMGSDENLDESDDALTAAIKMSLDAPPAPPSKSDPNSSVDAVSALLDKSTINDALDFDSYIAPTAQEVINDTVKVSSHLPPNLPDITPEPVKGAEGSTRLQLRLADGKTVVRRFLKSDPIALIYTVLLDQLPEARSKAFLLQIPTKATFNLLEVSDQTISDQDLANSKLMMVWDE